LSTPKIVAESEIETLETLGPAPEGNTERQQKLRHVPCHAWAARIIARAANRAASIMGC
jgi:hypothetical protein